MPVTTAVSAPSPPRARTRRKGNVYRADCPSRSVLDHVTSRWGVLALIYLLGGPYRFSELGRALGGVSEKMLAQTLQTLEADGFVLRTVYPTVPPKVEYRLTTLGESVAARIEALTEWVESNLPLVLSARAKRATAAARA